MGLRIAACRDASHIRLTNEKRRSRVPEPPLTDIRVSGNAQHDSGLQFYDSLHIKCTHSILFPGKHLLSLKMGECQREKIANTEAFGDRRTDVA